MMAVFSNIAARPWKWVVLLVVFMLCLASLPAFAQTPTGPMREAPKLIKDRVKEMATRFDWPRLDTKIYYGDDHPTVVPLSDNQQLSVAALFVDLGDGWYSYCSGTLISDSTLLTAAHCIHICSDQYGTNCYDAPASDITVVFGKDMQSPIASIAVTDAVYNPSFTGALTSDNHAYYDVAVLTLSRPATQESTLSGIAPISINQQSLGNDFTGQEVQVSGFGKTESNANNTLRYWTPLTIYNIRQYDYSAGDPDGPRSTCQGDSGGPTFATINGQIVVIGITSWGWEGCINESYYCRVDSQSQFILEHTSSTTPECIASCSGKECGSYSGCFCGTCPTGQACTDAGQCETADCATICADDACGFLSGCDCGQCAGNELCVNNECLGESDECVTTCASLDCGLIGSCYCGECSWGQSCVGNLCGEGEDCETLCSGKECGAVGSCPCGTGCTGFQRCLDGACVDPSADCASLCASAQCGFFDGCNCGFCDEGLVCDRGTCVDPSLDCIVSCQGLQCGDLLGCYCGTCNDDQSCDLQSHLCGETSSECVAACQGKECGIFNNCDCGHCPSMSRCDVGGSCVADPTCATTCANAECGEVEDCTCGECLYGQACQRGVCIGACIPNAKVCSAVRMAAAMSAEPARTATPAKAESVKAKGTGNWPMSRRRTLPTRRTEKPAAARGIKASRPLCCRCWL